MSSSSAISFLVNFKATCCRQGKAAAIVLPSCEAIMNRIEQLDKEIEELQAQMDALVQKLGPLIEERESLKHKSWIEESGITQDDVQLCSSFEMPTFYDARDLIRWMKDGHSDKKYFEWNGKVYSLEEGIGEKSLCSYEELPVGCELE